MWGVTYYTRPNGRKPAREWIDSQDNSIKPSIDARIEKLENEGLILVENGMLVPIQRRRKRDKFIPGLYELKHRGKKWRIATYHDKEKDEFILLCGWRKRDVGQDQFIDRARELYYEYKSMEEG